MGSKLLIAIFTFDGRFTQGPYSVRWGYKGVIAVGSFVEVDSVSKLSLS